MSMSLGPTAADARVWFWILSRFNVSNWNLWVCPSTLPSEMSCCKEEVNFLSPAKMVSKSCLKWWQINTCANWLLAFHLKGGGKKQESSAGLCTSARWRWRRWVQGSECEDLWWKRQILCALILGVFCSFCGDTKCINHEMERFEIVGAVVEKKRNHPVDRRFEAAAVKDREPHAQWLENIFLKCPFCSLYQPASWHSDRKRGTTYIVFCCHSVAAITL